MCRLSATTLLLALLVFSSPARAVELYGYWETSASNSKPYNNKFDYAEIQLNAEVVTPSSSPDVGYTWLGFHDGDGAGGQTGNVWKIRVMPLETGSHTVRWWWTGAGALPGTCTAEAKCSDTFSASDTGAHRGPLIASERHFFDSRGNYFPMRPYYLEQYHTPSSRVLWDNNGLDLVVANGFNALSSTFWQAQNLDLNFGTRWGGLVCAGGSQDGIPTLTRAQDSYCRNSGGTPGYGPGGVVYTSNEHFPLASCTFSDRCRPGDDVTTWSVPAMTEADTRLIAMASHDIAWMDFDGLFANEVESPSTYTVNDVMNRIKYYISRFSPLCAEGCLWTVAFECDEIEDSGAGSWWCEGRAGEIQALDPYDHPVGVHDQTVHEDSSNFDFTHIQINAGEDSDAKKAYDFMASSYYRSKPSICTECSWYGPESNKVSEDGYRTGMWGATLSGGVFVTADQFDYEPCLPGSPNVCGKMFNQPGVLGYARYAHDVVDSLDWESGEPTDAFISGGDGNTIGYASAGSYYLAYEQNGTTFSITPDGAGEYSVRWINPRTGISSNANPPTLAGGSQQSYSPPDENDWVLLAQIDACAASSEAPGGDADLDGICNDADNCPNLANPDQLDRDSDDVGDPCDVCAFAPDPSQADTDGDGIGDACECGDFNLDGRVTTVDARLISRCVVGEIACAGLCDVTGDDICSTVDARLVSRVSVLQLQKADLRCRERP